MMKESLINRRLVIQLTLLTGLYLAAAVPSYHWFMRQARAQWHCENPAPATPRMLLPAKN